MKLNRPLSTLLVLAAILGLALVGGTLLPAHASNGNNATPGCTVGNGGSDDTCSGGNTGQAGGGNSCSDKSSGPCGHCDPVGSCGTLNDEGNVPGCLSNDHANGGNSGQSEYQNPHCDGSGSGCSSGSSEDDGHGDSHAQSNDGHGGSSSGDVNDDDDGGSHGCGGCTSSGSSGGYSGDEDHGDGHVQSNDGHSGSSSGDVNDDDDGGSGGSHSGGCSPTPSPTPKPTPTPTPKPTQTLVGHIYNCSGGVQTTTEVSGGTLKATGPQTVGPIANPLSASVAAGTYTMTATAPTGYLLVACGDGQSSASSETVTVPSGGTGTGIFYVNLPAVTPTVSVYFGYADSCTAAHDPSNVGNVCGHAETKGTSSPRQFPAPFFDGSSAWSLASNGCTTSECYAGCTYVTASQLCDIDGSAVRIHNSGSSPETIANFQISFAASYGCVFGESDFWHLTSVTVPAGGDLIFAPTGDGGTAVGCASDTGYGAGPFDGIMDGSDVGATATPWTNACANSGVIPVVTFTATAGTNSVPVHIADNGQILNTYGSDIGGVNGYGWTYGTLNPGQVWLVNATTHFNQLNTSTYTGYYCTANGVNYAPQSNESISWTAVTPN